MSKYDKNLFEPFAIAFCENSDKSVMERFSLGMIAEAEYFPVNFSEKAMLPSVSCFIPGCAFAHPWQTCIDFEKEKFRKKIEENPEKRDELFRLYDEMMPYIAGKVCTEERTFEYVRFSDSDACWGGRWIGHGNPDFGRILTLGTDGIRKLIEENRAENSGKDDFYNACRNACDAFDIVCENIRKTALKNAENETDSAKKAEFEKIASVFEIVPKKPAWDFYSAVMCFWAAFSVQGCDSPGNLDRFLYEFFKKSPEDECEQLVKRMLEGFHDHRSWNVCIGGSDENWNDTTNELSYMILRLVTESGYNTPNLTMRVHRNTPEKLWDMAIDCIGTGTGLPAIYNDEVECVALEKIGIPPEHSHMYCMNGCNQIDIFGKSHMGLEDGEVNLGKVLEIALHNGYDMIPEDTPKYMMESLGNVYDCDTFDELLNLYLKYQDYITKLATDAANQCGKIYSEIAPNPFRSCLFEGCLEKGKDYKNGGPLYGHGQMLLEGMADAADSLYAIKKLIYDEKKYTLHQLIDALTMNFEGWDDLYSDFKNCPKFGNDIKEVDELCGYIIDHFNKFLKTIPCFRGGIFTGGCSTFNRAAERGMHVAALPNGKKKGECNYADSIAATPGCDVNGPTASILSCLHYDQTEVCSGFVTQMKFSKDLFCSPKGKEAFKTLAKVYFAKGGQQLSVNVVDKEMLLMAQKNPEQYKNLVVRVGGFSAYFCELDEDLQQNIIDRTEFSI